MGLVETSVRLLMRSGWYAAWALAGLLPGMAVSYALGLWGSPPGMLACWALGTAAVRSASWAGWRVAVWVIAASRGKGGQ